MSKSSQQPFHFLKVSSVHEYNTECVVMTYLPYHTTPQFLALLSILPASPPPALRFLLPYLTPPTNPPRQAIVYTAANTAQFFAALQRYVVKALQAGHEGSSLLSFWSGITAQAVAAILEQSQSGRKEVQGQRTEELLLKVLPALNECLKMLHAPEALMGSYMVIIIMATKGSFEDKVLDMFLEAVVRSLEPEIMESCLMCLAVIAEERSRPRFPAVVTKRILKVKNLVETLQSLSEQCSIGRLALGCSLGALERGIRLGQDENLTVFRKIVDSKLLDDPHTSLCLSALLQLIPDTAAGSEQHGRLIDLASKLGESPRISQMLRKLTKDHRAQFESLGLSLNHTSDEVEGRNGLSEDEEMVDVDEDMGTNGNVAPVDVPTITATSFLDAKFSEEYSATITAFEKTISSKSRTAEFQSSKELGRDIASEKALFLSFLARTWCSNTSSPTKVAALRSATSTIRLMSEGIDLQHLIPYLICALSDSTPAVRRATATCVNALSAKAAATDSSKGYRVWASSDLYGKDTSKISALPKGQTSSILSSALVPILEECAMDPSFIGASLRTLFGNASTSKQQHGQNLKSAAKTTLASFLASHVAVTPVLRVRLSLFTLFDFSGKLITGPRTNTLLPVVRSWCSLSTSEVTERCAKEDLDVSEVDKVHLAVLVGREPGSIELLKEILLGSINKERTGLLDAAFERLASLWPSLKAEARVSVGQSLLEAALRPECSNSIEELCRVRSLEALRNVKLDTAVLYEFLESIPAALQIPEGPPTKRRRRTSRSEMARLDAHSPDDVAKLVRRVTVILELVEGSNPKEHTALFKNIFAIFGDLQPLRQQSGSDLVYLQSLVLGSLTPMVHGLKVGNNDYPLPNIPLTICRTLPTPPSIRPPFVWIY